MTKNLKRLNALINEANEDEDISSQKLDEFSTLDLRNAKCFGYSVPIEKSWVSLATQASEVGWNNIDVKQLERNLTKNVEQSYLSIASFKMVNVADDFSYDVRFDNNKAMWTAYISNSPDAELTPEQQSLFFKSELFIKTAKKTYYRLMDAIKAYNEVIHSHINDGSLLLVDVVKLEAILHFLNSKHFLENLRNGKSYFI